MKSKKLALAALATTILVPALALAQTSVVGGVSSNGSSFLGISFGNGVFGSAAYSCSSTICTVGATILYIINSILVPLLFAVAFIVFLYGVFKSYILSHGDPGEVKKGHQLILWGVIGFAVMLSLWGLVNVVTNTFGLSGAYAPPLPTSY